MNEQRPETNNVVWIDAGREQPALPFECQPLFTPSGGIFGHELLFRGTLPQPWLQVDASVIRYLGTHTLTLPRVFVNLANDSLLGIPDEAFVRASQKNEVIFELSEAVVEMQTVSRVAAKVNRLIAEGVRFAIDDFGNGIDGLLRLYSVDKVACIKVDGAFLRICMSRKDAADTIRRLIAGWKQLQILVVAEWIETPELFAFAKSMDFDLLQGWYVDALFAFESAPVAA